MQKKKKAVSGLNNGVRHTFCLISLLSLHDDDLKFPNAVYYSTFGGGPKPKTCNCSFSFSQLGYGLNSRPGEFGATFFLFFCVCGIFAAAAGL